MRVWIALAAAGLLWGSPRQAAPPPATVSMVVTAEGRKDKPLPEVAPPDVMVYAGKDRLQVTGWTGFRPDRPQLQLFVLLDDSLGDGFGTLLDGLRRFIEFMPPGTDVGLAYMQHGSALVVDWPTADLNEVAGKLRLPMATPGISPSPYLSVQDLIKHWPGHTVRREVLAITSGIEHLDVNYPQDQYLDNAIAAAQRAGVIVHTIYAAGAGHFGHTLWRINWAQSLLSQLADRTGGEAWFEGLSTPVSLQPYLNALKERLAHQHLLTFIPPAAPKSALVPIRVRAEVPGVDLVAADKVYVPAH